MTAQDFLTLKELSVISIQLCLIKKSFIKHLCANPYEDANIKNTGLLALNPS